MRKYGKIHAGTSSDELVSAMDLLPTLCHLTGVDLSDALKQLQPRTPESSGKESSGKESSSLFPLQLMDDQLHRFCVEQGVASGQDIALLAWHGRIAGDPERIMEAVPGQGCCVVWARCG